MAHQDTTDTTVETPSEAAPDPKSQVDDTLNWDTSPPTGEDDSDIDGGPDCPLPDGSFYGRDSTVDAKQPDDDLIADCPGPEALEMRNEWVTEASDPGQPDDTNLIAPTGLETSPTDGRDDHGWNYAADPKS